MSDHLYGLSPPNFNQNYGVSPKCEEYSMTSSLLHPVAKTSCLVQFNCSWRYLLISVSQQGTSLGDPHRHPLYAQSLWVPQLSALQHSWYLSSLNTIILDIPHLPHSVSVSVTHLTRCLDSSRSRSQNLT
ncbi:hypothetical protein RchiOBHm_Chr1g0326831 [Rosa chinensis]|uniref:Uncharacterized protein n=1 Tax=Rosa chinensis TaxID=74649 RepID=A0A2P6SAB9_ROSCH|nr:hypothetical protein RchiOBHm_Chr1g0326831 [Rosa chinensis]